MFNPCGEHIRASDRDRWVFQVELSLRDLSALYFRGARQSFKPASRLANEVSVKVYDEIFKLLDKVIIPSCGIEPFIDK